MIQLKYFVNTDAVDIRNKQIGIHASDCVSRELCAGVNHNGTKASVQEATRIAHIMAAAPELLKQLIVAERLLNTHAMGEAYLERGEIAKAICRALRMDYGTVKSAVYEKKVKEAMNA